MTTAQLSYAQLNERVAENLRSLALILDMAAISSSYDDEVSSEDTPEYLPYGTIVKALPDQTRFKPKSMWVSLGNGKYQHLNGKKGLVTTHERLDGYTDVVFEA